ncbi:hypothetical protein [Streptomyces africanus]|uniref:hypothetical protein n=1 Tax=Streptomyces africanus TaxID=231024 RepID=UPI000A3AD4F6|nr:hypothetical protein [Streptomyces africanus]
MKNPTRALGLLNAVQTVTVIASAAAVSITVLELADIDLGATLTLGGFLSLAAALAIGYVVAGFVDTLVSRVARPYRTRLEDQADLEEFTANEVPGESIAVAVSIQTFLADLRNGLPLAVKMAGPGGRMPFDGAEWIAYVHSTARAEALATRYSEAA